tara:strand:+ start:170 stop:556 length:387 start_codon:yes stop_codon:yes gene_type:complete
MSNTSIILDSKEHTPNQNGEERMIFKTELLSINDSYTGERDAGSFSVGFVKVYDTDGNPAFCKISEKVTDKLSLKADSKVTCVVTFVEPTEEYPDGGAFYEVIGSAERAVVQSVADARAMFATPEVVA